MSEPANFVEIVRDLSRRRGNQTAYKFLSDGRAVERELGYGDLDRGAQAIAGYLQMIGASGRRALLLYPDAVDFIPAFLGCLYAGVVAVACDVPKRNRDNSRLRAIAYDADIAIIMSNQAVGVLRESWVAPAPGLENVPWMISEEVDGRLMSNWRMPVLRPNDLAYLQYTSGSTDDPKGVMISHGNLLYNFAYIDEGFRHDSESCSVTWLPHFHDMGLVYGLLQPLFNGFTCYVMSPRAFIQKPLSWLEAISEFRATHSGGPNFAYEICARRATAEQKAELDLTQWRIAFNGAERVRHVTLEHFAQTFTSCGFRYQAFYPAYGLAEATLKVTGGARTGIPMTCEVVQKLQNGESPSKLVSNGAASFGTEVVIVNTQDGVPCGPGETGEIWVSGPGVAMGYWNHSYETEKTFHARLKGSETNYLRTGDLGFLRDGELFITGRIKNLIIIRGHNYYPEDLEAVAEQCHAGLQLGGCAAFAIDGEEGESLIIVQEIARGANVDVEEVGRAIRSAIATSYELHVHTVVLIKPGSLPKTSSGKVQRHVCRERLLNLELKEVGRSVLPVGANEKLTGCKISLAALLQVERSERHKRIETYLRHELGKILQVNPAVVSAGSTAISFGIDSMMAAQMGHAVKIDLGIDLPATTFLGDLTLSEIASDLVTTLDRTDANIDRSKPKPAAMLRLQCRDRFSLSALQSRLWLACQLAPGYTYNVAAGVCFRGALRTESLEYSLREIIRRHEMLRTSIVTVEGRPQNVLDEHAELLIKYERLDGASKEDCELQVRQMALKAVRQPFDLGRAPLFRATCIRADEGEQRLLLTAHHLVTDGRSLRIVAGEFAHLYRAHYEGRVAQLPDVRVQYADFVTRQEERVTSGEISEQLSYWRQKLDGVPELLRLPTDRPRSASPSYQGGRQSLALSAGTVERLRQVGQQRGATLFMTLMAALQALLHRYSGQEDFCIGFPIDVRNELEFRDSIGLFINTVALRARVNGSSSLGDLLEQVRLTALEAYANREIAFDKLVEDLNPRRDHRYNPLFQVMFVWQEDAGWPEQLPNLEVTAWDVETGICRFDLTVTAMRAGDQLRIHFDYNADLFDLETVRRMTDHYYVLIETITQGGEFQVGEIPLVNSVERQEILRGGQGRTCEAGRALIADRFEGSATLRGDQIAVVCGENYLTYAELSARSNRLAGRLREFGVKQEAVIGLATDRSLEMIIAVFAIWKAGGAFLPFDPMTPQKRLEFMVNDANVVMVLTDRENQFCLPPHTQRFLLDSDWQLIAGNGLGGVGFAAYPENAAYVIYTSGSTGQPKGVAVQCSSVINLVEALSQALYGATQIGGLRIGLNAPIVFDSSIKQILMLLQGATLYLVPERARTNGAEILRFLLENRIEVLDCTPTHLKMLIAAGLTIREVEIHTRFLVGGEMIDERLWAALSSQGAKKFVNLYGPTECTVDATSCEISVDDRLPHIGRPLPNVRVYVVNDHMQLNPTYVVGEICIGGLGVARGYWNRASLTAEKFLPDPFSDQPGCRIYRTGDLACWLPSGNLRFVGRRDRQIKLRGHRIELEEIQAIACRHKGVERCIVLPVEDALGEIILYAYAIGETENAPTGSELRQYLRERLPAHLIPASVVILDRFPVTLNGKVDVDALRTLEPSNDGLDGQFEAPRTPLEEVIAEMWSEALGAPRVGARDNFFELGGHSLTATQLAADLQDIFPTKLPLLSLFFENPTVAALAEAIIQNQTGKVRVEEIALLVQQTYRLSETEIDAVLRDF